MKKVRTILLLSVSLAAISAPAVQAGPLRWVVETVGQKWATQQALANKQLANPIVKSDVLKRNVQQGKPHNGVLAWN